MMWQEVVRKALAIRRDLHRIPEPAWEEKATSAYVQARLDALHIPWRLCAKTGVVAYLAQGREGLGVALRADMDGLLMTEHSGVPWASQHRGTMHGCGHDGHMAVLLGAAEWLKIHEHRLIRPVILIFQPAEEGGHGAREMIREGVLEGVGTIFGWHNWPTIDFGHALCEAGPMMAANGSFRIRLHGKGGHASQPEVCRDPVLGAAALTMALQQIVSRRLAPNRAGVVSVTSIDGASGETVIPESAVLGGSVRMEDGEGIVTIGQAIATIAEATAAAYGLQAEVDFQRRYPALHNDTTQSQRLQDALSTVFGTNWRCRRSALPVMASEDFSYYLDHVPGAFALVGSGGGDTGVVACHNARYDFNDRLLAPMIGLLVDLAMDTLPVGFSSDF